MRKIFLIISIVTLVATVGFAQEATDNKTAPAEKPATAVEKPATTATPEAKPTTTAPATTAPATATPATATPATATTATAPAEADKNYKVYAEDVYVDNYTLPGDNMIYIMAFASIGIPLTSDNNFTNMPEGGASVTVGTVFKKYMGVELNFGYLTNDYFDSDDDYYYRSNRYNNADRYKNTAELYNIKLYLTGNLPIDFGNMRLMPYIGVGGAVTFSMLNWYEFNSINPTTVMYNKNYSFDVSVGPAAKVGVKYFYKNVVFEINVEYIYAYHSRIKNENLSHIGINAGLGFAF